MKNSVGLMTRLLLTGIGIATIGFVVRSVSSANAASSETPQQVGQNALDHVRQDFVIRSGTPQVLLTRSITREDLPRLSLPGIPRTTIEEPPLMLVIIKGDFGPSNLPSPLTGSSDEQYKYIGYVFDLWTGTPTLIMASPLGGEFRTALNDPTLPIVATPVPAPPVASPAPLHHYGEVVPTVPNPAP